MQWRCLLQRPTSAAPCDVPQLLAGSAVAPLTSHALRVWERCAAFGHTRLMITRATTSFRCVTRQLCPTASLRMTRVGVRLFPSVYGSPNLGALEYETNTFR